MSVHGFNRNFYSESCYGTTSTYNAEHKDRGDGRLPLGRTENAEVPGQQFGRRRERYFSFSEPARDKFGRPDSIEFSRNGRGDNVGERVSLYLCSDELLAKGSGRGMDNGFQFNIRRRRTGI